MFAITLTWPRSGLLVLGDVKATHRTRVTMLGTNTHLNHNDGKSGIVLYVPAFSVSDLPCMWAWVFKLSHVE